MAEQVVWWGFLSASVCSLLYVGAMAIHRLLMRRRVQARKNGCPENGRGEADGRVRSEACFARGFDSQSPFAEEILARYFVGKGLVTESEFAELLGDEEEQYHAIVMDEKRH